MEVTGLIFQTEKIKKRINLASRYIVLFLIPAIGCGICYFIYLQMLSPPFEYFVADRSDAFDTSVAFAFLLVHNKMDEAKRLSVPEVWDIVDTWPASHSSISDKCWYPIFDPDRDLFSSGYSENDREVISLSFNYDCPDEFLSINVDTELEAIDGQWTIVEIREFCVTRSNPYSVTECWNLRKVQ